MVWFGPRAYRCELGIFTPSVSPRQSSLLQTLPRFLSIEETIFDHRLLSRFPLHSVGIQLSFHHFNKGLAIAWTNVMGM